MDENQKLAINLCSYDDLFGLPSVGRATADRIWNIRKTQDITPEILAKLPYIRMESVLPLIDFQTEQEYAHALEQTMKQEIQGDESDEYEEDLDSLRVGEQHTVISSTEKGPSVRFDEKVESKKQTLITPEIFETSRMDFTDKLMNEPQGIYLPDIDHNKYSDHLYAKSAEHDMSYIEPKKHLTTVKDPKVRQKPVIKTNVPYDANKDVGCSSQISSNSMAPRRLVQGPSYSSTPAPGTKSIPRTSYQRQQSRQSSGTDSVQQPTIKKQPTMLKSLKFDGTENSEDWSSFLVKFDIFAEAAQWSDQEKRNHLCWCLAGAASRYGTNLIRHNKNMTFQNLVERMEQRFNHGNETETLQVQFYNSRQSPGESTEDWADRVSILADKAFKEVPEKYVTSQVITKFLQALNDKEAGKAASMLKPKTIEEACQLVKLSQHLDSSIYGFKSREQRYSQPETPSCQAMRSQAHGNEEKPNGGIDEQMATLMKNMATLQESTQTAFTDIKQKMSRLEQGRQDNSGSWRGQNYQDRRWSRNSEGQNTFRCFNCNGFGHIARHCKKPRQNENQGTNTAGQKKAESQDKPLNG